jgi:hypothetical protein
MHLYEQAIDLMLEYLATKQHDATLAARAERLRGEIEAQRNSVPDVSQMLPPDVN